MKTLVSPGDICTTIDSNGETPLHISIQKNKMECLKKMLELDISINARNNKGYTPLGYALLYGHMKIASEFVEKGAQVDEICVRKTGKTLLQKMVAINKPEAVRFLLENGALVNKCDECGMAPLHLAVITGHKIMVSILLEFGADINQINNFEQSPLHLAIQMNQSEMSKILINNGANLLAKDKADTTILNMSVSVGNIEICRQILKQTSVNLDTREKLFGRSPLHTACAIKSYPLTKLLLDYGANIKLITKNRKAPINIATEAGCTDIVKMLKEKSETLEKTSLRKSPLILAVDQGHLQIVQYIINSKGNNVNCRDVNGITPLHYASKNGLLMFVKIFVENGADVNAKDKRLKTPLHEAFFYGHDRIANYLVEAGADLHCLDDVQMSPFDYKTLQKLWTKKHVSDISNGNIFIFIPQTVLFTN
ncbi:ankyrin repeat RF_0381 isoform X3 [Octopus vulgaris]|uniref:Ankyrin repeat RF_0381 isoform X3 n=1 Tax=Octopus vulgaris TaxID=6645 RepID=A0AA36F8Y4_OCTVU|nr:ankyrin repeat RF_0381 isoform X3 [Octopus vulgaris]